MVWMTDASTFGIRNQWSLESLLRHHPCTDVQIVAPLLPVGFFDTFVYLQYHVRVIRFDAETFAPYAPALGEPGYAWVQRARRYKSEPYFPVHMADMLRMLVLFKEGGTYMDFDHIVLRPMMHLQNAIGSEICHDDNPDCVTGAQLASYNLTTEVVPATEEGVAAEEIRTALPKLERSRFDDNVRFTPCNGVLINWQPRHPFYAILLEAAETGYDPRCWGCLAPRLVGKVLPCCCAGSPTTSSSARSRAVSACSRPDCSTSTARFVRANRGHPRDAAHLPPRVGTTADRVG
jgi:hypothetical protein